MTESTWECICGKHNNADATICVLCKTPHDPERFAVSHPEGISRITGFIVGQLVLPLTILFGILVGGESPLAGIFVIVLVLTWGLIAKFFFHNEPSVRRVLHWLFPFAWKVEWKFESKFKWKFNWN